MHNELEKHSRAEVRWRILRILDSGRPTPCAETLIYRVLDDVHLATSPQQLRRELDYLRDKSLVVLHTENRATWLAELTAEGVDVVEYSIPAPAGIARPSREF